MPSFVTITDGKKHDVKVAKEVGFPLFSDSIVSMDRGYIDFKWLNSLDEQRIWFVTRAKSDIDYVVTGQHPVTGKGVQKGSNDPFNRNPDKELLSQRASADRIL